MWELGSNQFMDMNKNITENYDIYTVASFKTGQNTSKEVKSWVLIDDVTQTIFSTVKVWFP